MIQLLAAFFAPDGSRVLVKSRLALYCSGSPTPRERPARTEAISGPMIRGWRRDWPVPPAGPISGPLNAPGPGRIGHAPQAVPELVVDLALGDEFLQTVPRDCRMEGRFRRASARPLRT